MIQFRLNMHVSVCKSLFKKKKKKAGCCGSTSPVAAVPSLALGGVVGLVALAAGPPPSVPVPPSVPGALRISLEVSELMPVTAQPAQLDEAPAG